MNIHQRSKALCLTAFWLGLIWFANTGSVNAQFTAVSSTQTIIHVPLYTFNGGNEFDFFGDSVSGAWDVNGDGTPDLIVGASSDNSVRVLSGIDGRTLYDFDGGSAFDSFGISVSDAGDLNGDGIDDFIIGAAGGGANGSGYARVFVSQISVPGDFDADGDVDCDDFDGTVNVLRDAFTLVGNLGLTNEP